MAAAAVGRPQNTFAQTWLGEVVPWRRSADHFSFHG
jgi:hypothetical protein